MAQNNEKEGDEVVNKDVDNLGKSMYNRAKTPILHVAVTAFAAAGLAIVHAFFTELDGCTVITADPETAGLLGGTIRAVVLSIARP